MFYDTGSSSMDYSNRMTSLCGICSVSYTHLDVYKRQDLERVLVIDDRDTPLTLADERIARAIRENSARLVIIDPVQAFLGADVDMNRANEVRPIFRSLGDIAQATGLSLIHI